MNFLLDTCIISELNKPKRNTDVLKWIDAQTQDHLFLSSITLGEIQKGIQKLPTDSNRRAALKIWFENQLIPKFDAGIIPVTNEIAIQWGSLCTDYPKLPIVDGLLCATALVHRLTLVTRNTKDMDFIPGITLYNPWP